MSHNLGLEGVMLMGAFSGFITLVSGNALSQVCWLMTWWYVALMGLVMGVVSISLKAEQGISGIGLYLFGWGLSGLFFRLYVGGITTIEGLQPVKIPLLADIPYRPALFDHSIVVYLALRLCLSAGCCCSKHPGVLMSGQ